MDFVWLRLMLAMSVAVAHFHVLMDARQWTFPGVSATVAVQAFFVVSGWIVTASYRASSDAGSFYVRRFARLYPLYAVVVLLQAIAVLAVVDYDGSRLGELGRYLVANLSFANFAQPSLLGFLADAPVHAINPSLWTLKIEVLFYMSVPLWVWLADRWEWRGLGLLFIASTLFAYAVTPVATELGRQLPGQLRFFIIGMVCERLHARHDLTRIARPWILAVGIATLCVAQYCDDIPWATAVQPINVALFVAAGHAALPSAKSLPDISYGVYLVHAPLIQFARQQQWIDASLRSFVLVMIATLIVAWVMSALIELPAIRIGRRCSDALSAMLRRCDGKGRPIRAARAAAKSRGVGPAHAPLVGSAIKRRLGRRPRFVEDIATKRGRT